MTVRLSVKAGEVFQQFLASNGIPFSKTSNGKHSWFVSPRGLKFYLHRFSKLHPELMKEERTQNNDEASQLSS